MIEGLSKAQQEKVQESNLKSYIAGVFDGIGGIHATIKTGKSHRFGYRLEVLINLQSQRAQLVALFEDWCTDLGINPTVTELERKRDPAYRLTISRKEDIATVLSELSPFLLAQAHDARLVLNEILPRLQENAHYKKEGFVEIVELMDEMDSSTDREYDAEYFREKWADELEAGE